MHLAGTLRSEPTHQVPFLSLDTSAAARALPPRLKHCQESKKGPSQSVTSQLALFPSLPPVSLSPSPHLILRLTICCSLNDDCALCGAQFMPTVYVACAWTPAAVRWANARPSVGCPLMGVGA